MTEQLLNTEGAAAKLQLSPRYLEKLRLRGGGPPYVKIARNAVRYRPEDLSAWAAAKVVSSTSERVAA
jgi:hypothetical protein